jgi:hypothetical protein
MLRSIEENGMRYAITSNTVTLLCSVSAILPARSAAAGEGTGVMGELYSACEDLGALGSA